LSTALIEVNDSNNLSGLKDDVDLDYILSELYRRVRTHNTKEAKKIVYKGNKKLIYKAGKIVLFAILLKNRLIIEATCLLCRILIIIKGAYTLLSQYSPLKGRHQGSSLIIIKT
jgi:hypothetical protein